MDLEKEKMDWYRELVHGGTIKLEELYEKCLFCSIEKSKPYITTTTILIHDVSGMSKKHNTLIISANHLPVVTTMTTKELINDYERNHDFIFEKVRITMINYDGTQTYKTPYVAKDCVLISPTGSIKQEANFFNVTHLDALKKLPGKKTILSFSNHLDVEDSFDKKIYDRQVEMSIRYYFSYFYPSLIANIPYVSQTLKSQWAGEYISQHLKLIYGVYKNVDIELLNKCQYKAINFIYAKMKDPSLTISEYFNEQEY